MSFIVTGEPEYTDAHMPTEPKGQVVFTTTFINDTAEEHEYRYNYLILAS